MKTKTFDCVEMKKQCQQKLRKGMGEAAPDEELAFLREAGQRLTEQIKSTKREERKDEQA